MIILDTNVVSELMADEPHRSIAEWLDLQPSVSLWTTTITVYEIQAGLALMPAGRRHAALQSSFDAVLTEDLQHRILDFDYPAATAAADIAARRQRAGLIIDIQDTQIAGIAVARRATIATRNVRHFKDLNVPVINPWDWPPPSPRAAPSAG